MRIVLIFFHLKYKGDWKEIYKALEDKEKVKLEDLIKTENENADKYITIIDDDYPEEFKQQLKPPFVVSKQEQGKLVH